MKSFAIVTLFVMVSGCASLPFFDFGSAPNFVTAGLETFSFGRSSGFSRRTEAKAHPLGDVYRGNHGLLVAQPNVSTRCLRPKLRRVIKQIEGHFRTRVVLTSGYRSPAKNRRLGGASKSKHLSCEAADIYVPGVAKSKVLDYARKLSDTGGVGCYPGRRFFHIDVRRRVKGKPTYFKGCPGSWKSSGRLGILWF